MTNGYSYPVEVEHMDPDECQTCYGAGFETCTDPLCTEPGCGDGWHDCPNCGGSGRAADQQW